MPDYSLKRNTPLQEQTQVPPMQPIPQPHNSPISQLTAASQQAKMETENALLREALATSAQNYEILTKQFTESQEDINSNMMQSVLRIQRAVEHMEESTKKHQHEVWTAITSQGTKHQNQITELWNQNDMFSRSLKAVLAETADKLLDQVKADTVTVLQEYMDLMESVVQEHITAINSAYEQMTKANTKVRSKS